MWINEKQNQNEIKLEKGYGQDELTEEMFKYTGNDGKTILTVLLLFKKTKY